ncbi:MAG TPA: tetratricopeptide repeat protein [Bryobacteraceae bacterium]|nr:tetratricopeptide repeat protein [Bryobacteraceae bacterium]
MAKRRSKPQQLQQTPHPRTFANICICLLLLAAVLAVYAQTLHFDFVTFDDPDYVTENPHVQAGLTLAGLKWAFGSAFAGNWFPLTWISHMLDCQFFGLDSGWHHFMNVCIHALTTMLLFVLLRRATGAPGRSAIVAFLFAVHPLHVESVAWVAERKDVLSGLFWVLTLWAYSRYAERPEAQRYGLTFLMFALGLMAKPMLVTLPLVLLLWDRWPLDRGFRILEKIPFVALSAAASVVTYIVHANAGAAPSFVLIPPALRVENALVSYARYLLSMLFPMDLAVFYPYSVSSLALPAAIAAIVVAAITIAALRAFPDRPYLTVGWFWYLVTLLPVIGLIQVGSQSHADRYTYIPMIGVSIAVVWGLSEILAPRPRVGIAAAAAVCAACLVLTWMQLQYWRDSVALYQRAIDVTADNYLAHFNLGSVFEARGDLSGAASQLRETVRIRPNFAIAYSELGQVLSKLGHNEEAVGELQKAVSLKPDNADVHLRLGAALGALNRSDEAAGEFSAGLAIDPNNADAHYNLGMAFAQSGKMADAVREFRATVQARPNDFEARYNLGLALARTGNVDESLMQLSEAVRLNPSSQEARETLEDVRKMKK